MTYTQELSEYAASLTYESLPETAVLAAKRVTLDLLGVTLPATRYGPGVLINRYVQQLGGRATATVIGTNIRTSTSNAALANGTMAADMEQDDVHPESNLHASSVFVPALLAVAEDQNASGRQWITALVAAYDVGCRISTALEASRQFSRGFHPTSVSGVFGATAGAAHLLALDSAGIQSALGLAGCQASGLLTFESEQEHFTKSFQSGVPARNAVVAAELAAAGYIGAADTLDGPYNIFDVFSTHRDFEALVQSLGERHEIEHTGYKFYSACVFIHSTLDAVLALAEEHGLVATDVDHIDVALPKSMASLVDNHILTTHNLQFIVAVALHDRKVGREQTAAGRRADPLVRDLASRIVLRGDDLLEEMYPKHWPTRVRLTLKDGRTFEMDRRDPEGAPERPASDLDIETKFERMASQVLRPNRVERIIASVKNLESLSSIHELTELLRVDENPEMSV